MWRLAAIGLAASCYSPQLQPCTVTCGPDSPCPDGLSCGSDSYCHSDNDASMCHAVLTVDVNGDGLVSSDLGNIDCTPFQMTCSVELMGGSEVTLTASAFGGGTFTGWSGDACEGSTEAKCMFELDISMTVSATFQ